MPSVLLTESLTLELEGQQQWPDDVTLYQQDEKYQILPDYANCIAVQTFLKINNLKFELVAKQNAEFMSPSGKLPFIKCGAFVIAEYESILSFVSNKGIGTSQQMDKAQWADMRAYMSLVNNVLQNAELYMCWYEKSYYDSVTWHRYSSVFSWPLNYILTWQKKQSVTKKLKVLGWTKKTKDQVLEDVKNCCHSLSERLDKNPYFFGEFPTELDALLYGHMFCILTGQPQIQELGSIIKNFPNLLEMCSRLETNYLMKN
ncbi:hypothetical protein RUM44_001340 [Polyplax serrata]|uniref:Metaxin-2 n=1 Tax=Polyplax serrata TaxID=468196 RepID=A0ABR1AJS3_POLSC